MLLETNITKIQAHSHAPTFHVIILTRQAISKLLAHARVEKIATGSYTKKLLSLSLLCGYPKPRSGALSLGTDSSYEYMKHEVAVDKRLVWRQEVGAATDVSLL